MRHNDDSFDIDNEITLNFNNQTDCNFFSVCSNVF